MNVIPLLYRCNITLAMQNKRTVLSLVLNRLTTGEQRIPAVLVKTSSPVAYTVAL
jgi:hypothetical protein